MSLKLLCASVLCACTAFGGLLDKAWIKGETDKDPVSYRAGEEMTFTLTAMDLDGAVPPGEYFLDWKRTDDFGTVENGRIPLESMPFTYKARLDKAGFVRLEAYVVDKSGKRYTKKFLGDATTPEGQKAMNAFEHMKKAVFFDGGAGADVDTLASHPEPKDFDAFWAAQYKRLDLVPLKAATFYMSNDWRDGRTHHKVTLTRPFWMSKYLLTADQCRDFAPNDYEDCRAIEKALKGTGYTVSKRMTRRQIDAFCQFLSEKYRPQLPKGYVFRLPTEAEWEYTFDPDVTTRMYEDKGGWVDSASYWSRTGFHTMQELRKTRNLDAVSQWNEDPNWGRSGGWTRNEKIFIGGRMKPFAKLGG